MSNDHELKAIPTEYGGIMFRSRTEARWAVFFTAAQVEFHYESEGFDLDGVWYLPDFWLPQWRMFVEVKPFATDLAEAEIDKCARLAKASGNRVLIVRGAPSFKTGILFAPDDDAPGSFVRDMGSRPAAFFAVCRRCPRIVLPYAWTKQNGSPIAWGEQAVFGPCQQEQKGSHCHDRVSPFGHGFENAIRASNEFSWRPKTRIAAE